MDEETITCLIKEVSIRLRDLENSRRIAEDITPAQSFMLGYLISSGKDEFFASHIQKETGVSKATVSSVLKGLKQKEYLTMVETSEDERRKRIRLTPKAYALAPQITAYQMQIEEVLCRGIEPGEIEIIRKGLETMRMNINTDRSRRIKA